MARAPVLFKFTAAIGRVSAGRVAGIATIASASVVLAANGVVKAVGLTPALGWGRFGIATIEVEQRGSSRQNRGRPWKGVAFCLSRKGSGRPAVRVNYARSARRAAGGACSWSPAAR